MIRLGRRGAMSKARLVVDFLHVTFILWFAPAFLLGCWLVGQLVGFP